ncbi:PepSY-associated TM helix domain-containing protein [Lysobacter korlensis]|uniref:PepSY-associated TM helix domain-containing protein n=1 Tax=Lysobacter korlensis TaxID=553636 RepID=A0ABV6RJH6_9GAMM
MVAVPLAPPTRVATLWRRVRALLAWLHLWVGLSVGAVFAVVGLSGSVLVFHSDLLRLQHPQLTVFEPQARGEVLAAVLARETSRGLRSLQLPAEALPVWMGFYEDGRRAYFAPDDGRLLLVRSEHDDALIWLHELHTHLLGGETGEALVGIVGWIALGLTLTGLYLWWPKRGRMLAQLRVFRGPPVRRWLTWHRSAGVVLLPVLLLAVLTGIGMVYHGAARSLLTGVFGGGATPDAPVRPADGTPVDWPRVLSRAQSALPSAALTRTAAPAEDSGVVSFRARNAGEWHPYGRTTVHVDTAGQQVLRVHDATRQPLGARMTEAIYPLHIGSVGGAVVKWLTALTGLLPTFLLATGFLFWRRRRGH